MGWPYQQKPPMGWPLDYDSGLVPNAGFWPMPEGSGGQVYDLSGNGNTGTLVGDTHWAPGKFGSALSLDGSTDSVVLNNSHEFFTAERIYDNATIVAWVTMDAVSGEFKCVMRMGNSWFLARQTDEKMYLYNGAGSVEVHGTTILSTATWYQVVATISNNGAEVKIYVNGIEEGSGIVTGIATEVDIDPRIGEYTSGNRDWAGDFDHLILYNRTLSASEIALLYREPFCMFKDPAEIALLGGYQAVPSGMAGAMTTNTGYWGW